MHMSADVHKDQKGAPDSPESKATGGYGHIAWVQVL